MLLLAWIFLLVKLTVVSIWLLCLYGVLCCKRSRMTMNSLLLERARFLLLLPLLLSFHSALPLSSLDVFSDLLAPCLHSTPSWAHLCPSQHSALHGSLLPMVKGLIYLSLQCPRKQTSYSPQAELFAIAAAIEYANEDLRSSNQGCEYLYRLSTSICN